MARNPHLKILAAMLGAAAQFESIHGCFIETATLFLVAPATLDQNFRSYRANRMVPVAGSLSASMKIFSRDVKGSPGHEG